MKSKRKMWLVIVLVIVAVAVITIALVRGFSGEDDWTCKDGQWQKHGNPSSEAPSTVCPIK